MTSTKMIAIIGFTLTTGIYAVQAAPQQMDPQARALVKKCADELTDAMDDCREKMATAACLKIIGPEKGKCVKSQPYNFDAWKSQVTNSSNPNQ